MTERTQPVNLLDAFEGMFSGEDGVVQHSQKVVITRVEQFCPGYSLGNSHLLPVGTRVVREKALVDGKWAAAYTCERCILNWRKTEFGNDD